MAPVRLILMTFLALRLLGGDVAMLQVVAWAGMIVDRSGEQGVAKALESTFDGEHPCALCKAIRTVPDSDRKTPVPPDQLLAKLKLKDAVRTVDLTLDRPPLQTGILPAPDSWREVRLLTRSDAPPVPPPRGLAV